jgi:hypothetical protein
MALPSSFRNGDAVKDPSDVIPEEKWILFACFLKIFGYFGTGYARS